MINFWTVCQVKIHSVRNKTWSAPSVALHSGGHMGVVGRVIPDTTIYESEKGYKGYAQGDGIRYLHHIRRSLRIGHLDLRSDGGKGASRINSCKNIQPNGAKNSERGLRVGKY